MKIKRVSSAEKLKAHLFLPLAIFLMFPAIVFGARTNQVCAAQCDRATIMCQRMAYYRIWERHHAMLELQKQMKADNEQLNHLLATMNKAKGKRKVDAIAAVVNAMVHQRLEMQKTMMRLHHQMMRHMIMERRTWNGKFPESCPMMKCPMSSTNAPVGDKTHK